MTYIPSATRYDGMQYRRVGNSGLLLPAISLGLWQNFGDDRDFGTQRSIIRRAFDKGVTHFDLANNYGTPSGSAETNFGRHLREDFSAHRDELIVSSKAGYDMWPGPYGEWGSRKYLLASLDQSLARLGLDYVDIFYSHRPDPNTPIEETMGALHTAVTSGRALYVGVSNYSPEQTRAAIDVLATLGTPLTIHQPSYSMTNRWVEGGLLQLLSKQRVGSIAFSPLSQGVLTDRYLNGVPSESRAASGGTLGPISEDTIAMVRRLNSVANNHGLSLAQLALTWVLRGGHVTSALVGASSVDQLDKNLGAVGVELDESTLVEIEKILDGD